MAKPGWVYILASGRNGTLYIGVTTDLPRRVGQHKEKNVPGFTNRYDVDQLVWFESCEEISGAILREKQLKKWRREWKLKLIERSNPEWRDLYPEIIG
ncbi:GIY-YIG nuclease family protein [Permianibacter aggregans]|uniref:Putative endonuclease n=1 Tax=Permianibacter aggregans TaxID=1510150 RepID=A0A4R6ULC8_9GAMM|nr:GIY-YIG nuclease family protein [Permianibacter aggregans]QGX39111.1 GIY-YIG nuclease family protein [Permianibacter aggregans]TDQ47681.1 putative endonuclease [Permianibacter aggregans]